MLTLDATVKIPPWASFASVDEGVVLLNTRSNFYFSLDEVGSRFWELLHAGKRLQQCYRTLLKEFEVEPARLEADLLELLENLQEQGLVEIDAA